MMTGSAHSLLKRKRTHERAVESSARRRAVIIVVRSGITVTRPFGFCARSKHGFLLAGYNIAHVSRDILRTSESTHKNNM